MNIPQSFVLFHVDELYSIKQAKGYILIDQSSIDRIESENRQLKIAVKELSVLNDIATAITSTQSVDSIVDMIVQNCVKHFQIEQCAVQLLDEKNEENPFQTMVRKQDSQVNGLPYRLDTQLTGWMLKHKVPLLINNLETDDRINWVPEPEFPVHTLLTVPMMAKGKMIGLITVFNKMDGSGFTPNDQRLLSIIASQSSQIIENARLYEEEKALMRYQEDMRMASQIQKRLLPVKDPSIPGYEITGKSVSAKEVGGDYFDYIEKPNGTLAFCLGDISGKGMPASLLMANLQATLRGQSAVYSDCSTCVAATNTLMYHSTDENKFATLFYGILDPENNTISYCNGGHNLPMLFKKDKLEKLDKGGLVVGFMARSVYEEARVRIDPGDVFVLFSDGITEAMNRKREEYDEPRLEKVVAENKHRSAKELVDIIFQSVNAFVQNEPQMDDMTLVVIKRQ